MPSSPPTSTPSTKVRRGEVTVDAEPTPADDARRVEPAAEAALNAVGEKRPDFLLTLPDEPRIQSLARHFEAGDFRSVRQEAKQLLEAEDATPVQKEVANDFLARTRASSALIWLLGASIALFFVVVLWVFTHNTNGVSP